jgi:hypothetical protein
MTWPGPDATGMITLSFTPVDGSAEVITSEIGSWALLRMIRKGRLTEHGAARALPPAARRAVLRRRLRAAGKQRGEPLRPHDLLGLPLSARVLMTPAAGFFGKMPATGDFVARRLAAGLRGPLDRWLTPASAASRPRTGPRTGCAPGSTSGRW